MTYPTQLTAAELMRVLPYKHPFVMLDAVTDIVAGESAVGWKNIAASDPIFAGHFPGMPIYPGAMLIESSAQVVAVLLTDLDQDGPPEEPSIGYLATIRRFRFEKIVVPGDRLRIEAKIKTKFANLVETDLALTVDGVSVARGSMGLAIPERGGSV